MNPLFAFLVLPGLILAAQEATRVEKLPADAMVGGRPCRRGWIHLHPDGTPAGFTSAAPFALGPTTVPAGTWVRQDAQGRVTFCAFPCNLEIEGHLCRGTGGAEGVTTAFHPNGRLKAFFLGLDTVIQGLPCRAGRFRQPVELDADGRLKACELSADFAQGGRSWRKGTRVHLDPDGHIRD
jgi:hypothetical protein